MGNQGAFFVCTSLYFNSLSRAAGVDTTDAGQRDHSSDSMDYWSY